MALSRYNHDDDDDDHDDHDGHDNHDGDGDDYDDKSRLYFPGRTQKTGVPRRSTRMHLEGRFFNKFIKKQNRLNCSVCQSFLYQGARLSPPSWQHPLQCTRQGGDRGDHYHSHAHDYDNHDHR